MTASLTNTVTLLGTPTFREKVKAAMLEAAVDVFSETQQNVALRILRTALANAIVNDADTFADKFARLVANDATVSAVATPGDVTDPMIRAVVTGMWNAVAASVPNLRV